MQIRQTGGPEVLNWTAVDVGEPGGCDGTAERDPQGGGRHQAGGERRESAQFSGGARGDRAAKQGGVGRTAVDAEVAAGPGSSVPRI